LRVHPQAPVPWHFVVPLIGFVDRDCAIEAVGRARFGRGANASIAVTQWQVRFYRTQFAPRDLPEAKANCRAPTAYSARCLKEKRNHAIART
jgi:hypothetical protein